MYLHANGKLGLAVKTLDISIDPRPRLAESADLVRGDRASEAFQLEVPGRRRLDRLLYGCVQALLGNGLVAPGADGQWPMLEFDSDQRFAEPVALSSTQSVDRPLPR
jgi:hypothetical protein